jgi:hypothetical protein
MVTLSDLAVSVSSVPVWPLAKSVTTMSNMPSNHPQNQDNELLAEYRFDYQKAKPNRFAAQDEAQTLTVVVLDEDVAQVFKTPESVNKVLRALIQTMSESAGRESV